MLYNMHVKKSDYITLCFDFDVKFWDKLIPRPTIV